jgi:hypothetical protein
MKNDDLNNLIEQGLAKKVVCKDQVVNTNFDDHAQNVEAILINPDWNLSNDKK